MADDDLDFPSSVGDDDTSPFDDEDLSSFEDDDQTEFDEDDQEMPAIRTTANISKNQDLLTFNEVQTLFTPGVGLVSGQGNDPIGLFSFSKDGGYTWSNERDLYIGKLGEYERRAMTWQLGQARNWAFRIKVTDPVNRDIIGAFGMAEVDNI